MKHFHALFLQREQALTKILEDADKISSQIMFIFTDSIL